MPVVPHGSLYGAGTEGSGWAPQPCSAASNSSLLLCLHCAELPWALVADCRVRWRRGGIRVCSHHVRLCFFFPSVLSGVGVRDAFPGDLKTKPRVVTAHSVKAAVVGWFGITSEELQHPWEGCGEPECSELAPTEPAGTPGTGTHPHCVAFWGERREDESQREQKTLFQVMTAESGRLCTSREVAEGWGFVLSEIEKE